jgi:RAB protein geranylgeranyltransferase component A
LTSSVENYAFLTDAATSSRALSRSGKKILHVDKNDYYGGTEAAFSLQEAESWAEQANSRKPSSFIFSFF